jgi:hypothetical protein
MMMISLVQAYECRKITTEYRESFWIGASVAITAQVWLIALPLLRLLDDNPSATFLTQVGVVFVTSFGTLLFVFGPKIAYLIQDVRFLDLGTDEDSDTDTYSDDEADGQSGASSVLISLRRRMKPRGILGIRVVQSSVIHSEEVDTLEIAVEKAERRNRSLQLSLEKLQEKMEQFIVARDPLGSDTAGTGVGGGSGAIDQQQNSRKMTGPGSGPGGSRFSAGGTAVMVGRSGILIARPGQITSPEPSVSFRN